MTQDTWQENVNTWEEDDEARQVPRQQKIAEREKRAADEEENGEGSRAKQHWCEAFIMIVPQMSSCQQE